MPIPNYVRPQLTIAQLLEVLQGATSDRITGVVIGPQYLLNRYGKETTPAEDFDSAGQNLIYKYTDANGATQTLDTSDYAVDTASVRVFGVGLEAVLASYPSGGTNKFFVESLAEPNVIRFNNSKLVAGGTLDTALRGRAVAVGDIVYINNYDGSSAIKRRVVTGLRGQLNAATYGTNTDKDNEAGAGSGYNPVTDASADATVVLSEPSGFTTTVSTTSLQLNVLGGLVHAADQKYGEEFTLTVNTGGDTSTATFDITSKSGKYAKSGVASVDATGDYSITNTAAAGNLAGINVTIATAAGNVTPGMQFKFRVYQAYERLSTTNFAVTGSRTYTGEVDTTYIIKVTTGSTGDTATGAVVQITDTAGIDEVTSVTLTDDTVFDVGSYGMQAKFQVATNTVAQEGLRAGDVYYLHCVAAAESTTAMDAVVLDGPAVDTTVFTGIASNAVDVEFRVAYTGEILSTDAADGSAWSADGTDVTVDSGLSLYVAARDTSYKWVSFADEVGTLAASYRAAMVVPANQDKILIESVSDITDKLGTIDLDNDLAFGANEMFSGSQGKRIYALRTSGTSLANYTAALRKIESTDSVYALCPLTESLAVKQAVASHCESMSSLTKKNFRRCYVGTDSPGQYVVLRYKTDGITPYTATISAYDGAYTHVTSPDSETDFTALNIGDGDLLTIDGVAYEIDSIINTKELLLKTGPDAAIGVAMPITVARADTADSQVDYVVAQSEALKSRRAVNVWVDNGTRLIDGVVTVIPARFIAAEVAGLRTSVPAQQGLTHTEIQSVTDAPNMYVRFTSDDLDRAAAAGTFIITQEAESGAVYIRHQLTTETEGGSLYYEDSVGTNLDNISFKVKDALTGFVGKKNVTQRTLDEIHNAVWTILNDETQTDHDSTVGPALNGFDDPVVEAHATLKDRVEVYARLEMPLPLNNLDVTLEASVDFDL